jgi:hypothetical protein
MGCSLLQQHWQELLPLTTGEKQWKIARDLTLLALASYKGKESTPQSDSDEELFD